MEIDKNSRSTFKSRPTLIIFSFLVAINMPGANGNNCWGATASSRSSNQCGSSFPRYNHRRRYYYNRQPRHSPLEDKLCPTFDTLSDIFHYVPGYVNSFVRTIEEQHNKRQNENREHDDDEQHVETVNFSSSNKKVIDGETRYSENMRVLEKTYDDGSIELELELPRGVQAKDLNVEIDEDDNVIRVTGSHKFHRHQHKIKNQGIKNPTATSLRMVDLSTSVESKFEHVFHVDKTMDITNAKVTFTPSSFLYITIPKKDKKSKKVVEILTKQKIMEKDDKDGKNNAPTSSSSKSKNKKQTNVKKKTKEKEPTTSNDDDEYDDFIIFDADL